MWSLRPARQTRGRSATSLNLPLVQHTRERYTKGGAKRKHAEAKRLLVLGGWRLCKRKEGDKVEYTIYALKGAEGREQLVYDSMKSGEGRFGWSYCKSADLGELTEKIKKSGWASLSEDEKHCYQGFLLEFVNGDYVIYVNVPEWGKCTLARVTGPYFWKWTDSDFNHRFPVDPTSVKTFDRNAAYVYPAIRARLKLQGRYWRIYNLNKEFEDLLESLTSGKASKLYDPGTNLGFLRRDIEPFLLGITERIQKTHPNTDLERLFADVFKHVPGVKNVRLQGGSTDHGADILLIVETGLPLSTLLKQETYVVQVKSYEGEHWSTRAVEDIERAFRQYPEAAGGLIVSTANKASEQLEIEVERLTKKTAKPVGLLIGAELAAFLLKYGIRFFSSGDSLLKIDQGPRELRPMTRLGPWFRRPNIPFAKASWYGSSSSATN
jgi:hypothetical protein